MTKQNSKFNLILVWTLTVIFAISTLVLVVRLSNFSKEDDADATPASVVATEVESPSPSSYSFSYGKLATYMSGGSGVQTYASYVPATLTGQGSNYLNFTDNSGTTGRLHFSSKYTWQDGAVGTIKVQFVASGSNYTTPVYSFVNDGWSKEYVVDLVDLYEAGHLKANTEYTVRIDFSEVYETESGDYEDSNSLTCNTSKKIKLSVYGLPTAPTKTGYTFTGWYKDEACTQPYTDSTVIGDITLYAGFRAHTYSIVFNNNGGTGSMATMSMTYDVAKNLTSSTLSRTGYTFKGWATSSTGSVAYANGASVKNLTASDNGSVTLYAVWEEHDYTIKFNANGGTGTMTDMSMKYSQSATLTANAFTRTGYTFKGWATSASGAVSKADKASVSKLTATDGATITYYAVWEEHDYTIKFNANGGSGTMADMSMKYSQTATLTANTFTRTGYTFKGWATSASGAVSKADKASVSKLTATDGATVNYYAVWEEHSYMVKFNSNTGTGTMADMSMKYSQTATLTTNAFVKTGYTFQGWATSASGSLAYTNGQEISKLTATNGVVINLYAIWKANTYTIKFDKNGGTGTMSDIVMTYDQAKTLPANTFTFKGFHFVKWQINNSTSYLQNGASANNLTITANGVVTLKAVWDINTYNVKFNANGGSGTMADQTGIVYDIDTALTKNTFTREHYIFKGWATSANGSVVYTDGEELYAATESHNATINLYAVWQLNEHLVTFVANGNTVQSGYVIIGKPATIPTAPAKTGYDFVGWFLSDGTEYTGQAINAATTITARYEIIRCNIVFIVDGEVYAYAQVDYGTSILDALTVAGINNFLYEPEGDENF